MATPADFNARRYLELNPDLVAAYGWDENQATNHYLNWGAAENRNYGQAGFTGATDPHTYWASSGLPAAEIDRRIALGYAHPETWAEYGPESPTWQKIGGIHPNDPSWNNYLQRSDADGRATAAAQAAADEDGGLFGNSILNTIGGIAAAYFGGPIGSALYTGASGGDIGDMALAGIGTYAGGQLSGTGSGAAGGSWYSPSGDIGGLLSSGSAAAATGVGSINPALAASFESMYAPSAWASTAGAAAGSVAPSGWTQSAWDGLMSGNYSAVTGANAGSGAMDWGQMMDLYTGGAGSGSAGGTMLDMNSLMPDFTNYSGQMTQIPGLEQSLTQVPMDFSAGSALAQPGVWDMVKQVAKMGGDVKSVLSQLGITGTDAMKAIGALGSSALGYMGSNKQTDALTAQADKYSAMGAPYRDKLAGLYADPSKFLTSAEVQVPVQQGTNALMRSLSTQGNPWGSGNALQQGQNYASDQLFGKLGQEKDRLAGFGGLSSYNQAAPQASTNAIASGSNAYNAIGSGIGNIFNPPQTASQQMTALAQAMKGVNPSTGV
jgi:hypothetical protein